MIVEIGSGIGEATAALAAAASGVRRGGARGVASRGGERLGLIAEAGADNVRMRSVDAVWCVEHLLEDGRMEELWTFFPDPWHKQRHHKRRLVNPDFAGLVASRLATGGLWRLATDWASTPTGAGGDGREPPLEGVGCRDGTIAR